MKINLIFFILFTPLVIHAQSDSAWVAKFPPVPKTLKPKLEKDSIWWMNYKMDTTKFRLAIMEEINKERKRMGKKPVTYGTVAQTNGKSEVSFMISILNRDLNVCVVLNKIECISPT
jgi:hypothetical protein